VWATMLVGFMIVLTTGTTAARHAPLRPRLTAASRRPCVQGASGRDHLDPPSQSRWRSAGTMNGENGPSPATASELSPTWPPVGQPVTCRMKDSYPSDSGPIARLLKQTRAAAGRHFGDVPRASDPG
jgi:hypothetical protein